MADNDETTARTNGSGARAHAGSIADEATNAARRVKSAVEPEAEDLQAQVAQLQSDLKSITQTLNRLGGAAGNELRNSGQSAITYAQDEFGALEKQLKDTIREKPLTAVASAVAAGFILAVLTR